MTKLTDLRKDLRKLERPKSAKVLCRYFKTGPGDYGEGDEFLGLKTDETRSVAKKYLDLSLADLKELLASKIHEERSVAVMILTRQFDKADLVEKKRLHQFYLENLGGINNWDLVDGTAPALIGEYLDLTHSPKDILYRFAKSKNLWERRIAILATLHFIGKGEFTDTLKIAEMLLGDEEDLMHKAVGWMLREVGKRDLPTLENFLKKHATKMPRTALRYAIEKFPETKRKMYLSKR